MAFAYDKQQRAFIDAVTTLVRDDQGTADGARDDLWQKMVELDLTALLVPAEHDGLGLTAIELVGVLEAAGHAWIATPLTMTVGAFTPMIAGAAATSSRAGEIVGRLLEGATGTIAVNPACGACFPGATLSAGALTVPMTVVPDADAELVALPAVVSESGEHVLVVADREALGIQSSPGIGRSRSLGTLELSSHPIPDEWVVKHDARPVVAIALIAAAAELVGLADELVSQAVEHARQRVQFNQPVGHFQGVKHRLVDAHVGVERARSLTMYAAVAVTEPRPDAARVAHRAKAAASEAATAAARAAVQVHGASGITTANPVSGLYLRAREQSMLLGGADAHYACPCLAVDA